MQRIWMFTLAAAVAGTLAWSAEARAQSTTLSDDSPAAELEVQSYFQDEGEPSFSDAPTPPDAGDAPAPPMPNAAPTTPAPAEPAPITRIAEPVPESFSDEATSISDAISDNAPPAFESFSDSDYPMLIENNRLSISDESCGASENCCDDLGCAGGRRSRRNNGNNAWGELGDPIEVFGTHDASGLHIGGWAQSGYTTYNSTLFNNHPYKIDLNQAWIFFEKVADTSQKDFDLGFRVDYVYGTDGPDTQAFGEPVPRKHWDNQWDHGGFYGQAIPQAYVEAAYRNVSVKVGHFFTTIGYEVVAAPENFFYSHAFTMYLSEPFTHTGALATMTIGDNVTVHGGYTMGWDTGFDRYKGDTALAGVSIQMGEFVTATYAATAGNRGYGTDQQGYSHSFVLDLTLTDSLNYVVQSDYVDYNDGAADIFRTLGVNQYLFYTINDRLQAGVRAEWWQNRSNANNNNDIYGITAGLNIRPQANLVIRPEARYDLDKDDVLIPAPHNRRVGFGVDAIITF